MDKERLLHAIREAGITQKELSELSGVTEATISRYINGSRGGSAYNLKKLCEALNVSADYLLGIDKGETE